MKMSEMNTASTKRFTKKRASKRMSVKKPTSTGVTTAVKTRAVNVMKSQRR